MNELKWWQTAVFYQVYPRSFADSNGDGIGDLPGLIAKLDYLSGLGINGIWLSPHYPSPMIDCGYDISDYTAVASEYGSLEDFKRFLQAAHQREIRVIIDLVLNHTSDQHPWFAASRSSRSDPKHDWFIWHDGKDGKLPPNNWISPFGGSAWEYTPEVDQYYYHYFFKQQPDLNWHNPQVKEAMFNVMRFWLDMGVDGFRLDAIGTIFEDPSLEDHTASLTPVELFKLDQSKNPADHRQAAIQWRRTFQNQVDQPEIHGLLQELRKVVDEYDDRILVGESDEIDYCHPDELHMVFNFPLMRSKLLTPALVRNNQQERLAALETLGCPDPGAWPCNTLGNHDSPRIFNRFGDSVHDIERARLSLAVMATLRGTPFLYNGEEIGMTDLYLQNLDQFRDTIGVWFYNLQKDVLEQPEEQALKLAAHFTRDKNRTPMQWSKAANAGFCPAESKPWLPLNPNYQEGVNVESQDQDPESLLNFYRTLLKLRQQIPALLYGDYQPVHSSARGYLAFLRTVEEQTCLVVLNFSNMQRTVDIKLDVPKHQAHLLFSSDNRKTETDPLSRLNIHPFEIYIAELPD